MGEFIYWVFFAIRVAILAVITFYGFRFSPFFFPKSDNYFHSGFDVLKKRLVITGITLVVAANGLFFPELFKDEKQIEAQEQVLINEPAQPISTEVPQKTIEPTDLAPIVNAPLDITEKPNDNAPQNSNSEIPDSVEMPNQPSIDHSPKEDVEN